MIKEKLPVVLFNGTVATTNGLYRVDDIDVNEARKLVNENSYISAVGHDATAEVLTEVLGVEIPYNRIQFKQEVNQKAIVFKLNERPVEGAVLSKSEMLEIGYSLKLMERIQ
jgi:hypothetical protein